VLAQPKWTNIQAIFAKNCGPCHIGGTKTAGLSLDTYQAVIKPGNAAGSYLYQAVRGTQKVGARMPANGKVLPTTDIKNIYIWIQNGAKVP